MKVLTIHGDIVEYLTKRGLLKKFEKKIALLKKNLSYPSLRTELLEPQSMRIWSFRVDRKYRALFIFRSTDTIEILDVNNHYQ